MYLSDSRNSHFASFSRSGSSKIFLGEVLIIHHERPIANLPTLTLPDEPMHLRTVFTFADLSHQGSCICKGDPDSNTGTLKWSLLHQTWVKLAPALRRATVEIFIWIFFRYVEYNKGKPVRGCVPKNFVKGGPGRLTKVVLLLANFTPGQKLWPESFFILKGKCGA